MTTNEVRQKFLKFFEARGHVIVPSAPLVPENDSTVLFTTAGMQQFKPYYIGEKNALKDFGSKNTASVQKCVRTSDIDEVGDATHLTLFEMLGNFSFGGYGRKEAIEYAHDFITKELGLLISYVTVYKGSENVPQDKESQAIWKSLGVADVREEGADVFWGPTGNSGPCGPTTEIYCKPARAGVDAGGRDVEIWNIVFNEYLCNGSREQLDNGEAKLTKLPFLGIDTGMGLERLCAVLQKKESVYETDAFAPGIKNRAQRIIADHTRAATEMMQEGVGPSNLGRGYVLRRLIRRAILHADRIGVKISERFKDEEAKFRKTLAAGLKEFEKRTDPFILFTSYGFPIELTKELAKEKGIAVDTKEFEQAFEKHKEISRAGAEKKFKGGLADTSEMSIKYHTATHLLHQALRDVLGKEVQQKGSNITPERLRFDFAFSRKMTDNEKKKVEKTVNEKIKENLTVHKVTLPLAEAKKSGALHFFDEKYPDDVLIHYIGESLETAYSKEFCGGPHVANTGTLGMFRIAKEEAVSSGVRRIKAVLV
ncbi:MAG: hypothetical protein A3C08_00060 [Candidatus Taylorbacteria bacterium RIFCSPHIGHO2_02_FULL_47_18]|uniref:alanine--tRNA ligase n=1 Tax=Candidatus Taylorbacteria bacterium RIFCSPLOWO2_01_FULL_48_100 TaxID=1802322 RepID=A0A1G2NDC8_9BACT|nr:MAG: hypothetical protein A2670_01035 [Candidatus Taylorbacteria bacterium RIFCSPHIGHO2_01_FULL_48_38]OHA27993.1 MAG: hypothetical protein A3C08_00060 [Candidatus Taylorbacteria bacterium RIFCSPHIGHO2_02_FULL_47_18]OHA34033.1 MAG: hypothetical protein A2938_03085 [Candidatus Taylorbacteria bacterium RIFCSPLOWO2_01_FULL_48_100]OHA40063.1 MAG: hypothetical protein A3J31_00645 [Candidatus Taylorbacteria bacterium RIFCSPLOWO2_02_FULL_48_16]OHA45170.1 MAG: hypothetical protein A3H13_02335 [Candid